MSAFLATSPALQSAGVQATGAPTIAAQTVTLPADGAPPAPPPTVYTPITDDAPSRADDAWAGYSMMSLAVGLMVLVVVVALAACRGNATPGPRESLGAGMLSWGFVAVRYRLIISPLVLCLFGALIGAGVPRFEVDQGSISEWVAQGTRLEQQIKDWDTYVDDSVTDRTYAYILITAKDGSNLIDDPGKYLQAMHTVVQHAYTNASVTATDSNGHSLKLDWKDFCYSVNHPILTKPVVHPALGPLSPGTGTNLKPCINPSPLDAFAEQSWEFAGGADASIWSQQKRAAYDVIAGVAGIACAAYGAASPEYCGQIAAPFAYPSFKALGREAIIDRLKTIGVGTLAAGRTEHWIAAGTQPWGKLYGSFEGDSTGATAAARSLTSAKAFVYTLYQDIPIEVTSRTANGLDCRLIAH